MFIEEEKLLKNDFDDPMLLLTVLLFSSELLAFFVCTFLRLRQSSSSNIRCVTKPQFVTMLEKYLA